MNNVEEVNLVELEEKYGADLVNKLEKDIKFAVEEQKLNFKIETVDESKYFAEVVFVTYAYATIYRVSIKRKAIIEENKISFDVCNKVNQLFKQF
jgi:hypothetical protein